MRTAPSAAICAAALLLTGCGLLGDPAPATVEDPAAVTVGSGPEGEGRLVAGVLAELLRAEQIDARVVEYAAAEDARRALELGDVDVLPSYTGEAWLDVLGRADPPSDATTSLARVEETDEVRGLSWLRPRLATDPAVDAPPADATFAFVVQGPPGAHADLRTTSQLALRLAQLDDPTLCVDPEFATREDGLAAVFDAYAIAPERVEVLATDPGEAVAGVAAGGCVAGLTTATDGAAWAAGQRPLLDDLGVFPAFVVAPVVREAAAEEVAGLTSALQPWRTQATTARLGTWNARVAAGEPVEEVAAAAADELRSAAASEAPAPG